MTQPPSPGQMAAVDQAHAEASRFIDSMLTDGVSQLQSGKPQHDLFVWYGGSLVMHKNLTDTHLRVLLAAAAGKLAVLHHAIEQLADVHDANGMPNAAEELRKLVDQ